MNIKHNNTKITREKQWNRKGQFISEVQEFNEPVGYEDAFKKYYPKNDSKKQ